ncbi:Gp138 family membrane-puncturing spike protein [Acidaminococcus massiliensis]|uniref:Gp138 family membrane-puncturing spike protein n=1 Tax=Acidaminococcus massiliensis TaxID=1852375 RepID=UPI00248D3E9C|nr:Gp138 family membrane-puncturing spike protein [Acidaminococcus massiliensis]
MIPMNERDPSRSVNEENKARSRAIKTRVASPGIIQSFDPETQTVSVQLAIREKRYNDGEETWEEVPLLVDVPIVFPRAGGYLLTLPVQKGDECLVIFGDNCMDAWWQSGGVQNQIDCRRHDLSDGYAIPGPWSQPRVIPNYSTKSAQLRTENGEAYIELSGNAINLVGGAITIQGNSVVIGGSTTIDGKGFIGHQHGGVKSGGDNTGGVA